MKEPIAVSSPSSTSSPLVSDSASDSLRSRLASWPAMLGMGATVIVLGSSVAAYSAYQAWNRTGLIAPNVAIAGEKVGGLTQAQAVAHLEKRFGKLALTLKAGEHNFTYGLKDLGGKPSIEPTLKKAMNIGRDGWIGANVWRVYAGGSSGKEFMLPIEWNRGALVSRLKIADKAFATSAKDARLAMSPAGMIVQPEETGEQIDLTTTADKIEKAYYVGLPSVEAETKATEPEVTAAALAGHDVKLGEYRTRYNAGLVGRTTNIHVASSIINGRVLMPGDSFSFNQSTGERTWDKGYRMGHIFQRQPGEEKAEVVEGLAGGVCQVSSTLFNAVRKSNDSLGSKGLKITERNTHSLPVTYVPHGLDATVAWPGKDFKFKNTLNYPIYLRANPVDSHLTIQVWGRVPDGQG